MCYIIVVEKCTFEREKFRAKQIEMGEKMYEATIRVYGSHGYSITFCSNLSLADAYHKALVYAFRKQGLKK